MRIDLQCNNFEPPAGLREYVARRMKFAIGRFKEHIQWARIKVADVNGPRGGVDMRCVVQLRLRNRPDVVFAVTEPEARSAVDHAANRVAQVLARRMGRQKKISRVAIPDLLPEGA